MNAFGLSLSSEARILNCVMATSGDTYLPDKNLIRLFYFYFNLCRHGATSFLGSCAI